jgi:hypothetical protein
LSLRELTRTVLPFAKVPGHLSGGFFDVEAPLGVNTCCRELEMFPDRQLCSTLGQEIFVFIDNLLGPQGHQVVAAYRSKLFKVLFLATGLVDPKEVYETEEEP